MTTRIPDDYVDTVAAMQAGHQHILAALDRFGVEYEPYPNLLGRGRETGTAAARAYPIQGVLKYHGMSDWDWRIAYLPSISVNNDAAYTVTLAEFDPQQAEDAVIINGEAAQGRDRARVLQMLDAVRAAGGTTSRARVQSRNITRATTTGKGLGTSASASAALARAAVAAAFGEEIAANDRLVSCFARLLAGSGGRSAVGGVSLWLSYPGITHEDSFSVRLDNHNQLDELALISVPVNSRIGLKTEVAHEDAPDSPFFKAWMLGREPEIIESIEAVQHGDWRVIGQLAELDSIRLHGVTMSGSRENKIFAWEPENLTLFRMCNDLRSAGIPVYFSTDTGPTVVFLTHQQYAEQVTAAIHDLDMGFEVVQGKLGGPAVLIDPDEARVVIG